MTSIYLSRISLRDFRTFGNFDIDIPAAPGLTILTGTNGLGKSNFFDAIEWGLTGKVRRFSQYVEKSKLAESEYLTRTGATPNSHGVKLLFSDGTQVERNPNGATPMKEIIAQLTQRGRAAIKDLDTYLALTHFLGQASEQRFTSRESQEQWKALRGPSGIDRLESVRSGLRGRATTSAFTRRIDDEQSAIVRVEQKIAEWEGWQARLGRLRQAMRASGALTVEDVVERANTIEAALFVTLKENVAAIKGEASGQRLARLSEQLVHAIQNLTERTTTIESLSDLIDQFAIASVNAQTDHPVLVRARQDVERARAALRETTSKCDTADTNLSAQNSALRGLEQDIGVLEAVRSDLSRQQDIAVQLVAAEADQSLFSKSIEQRRAMLAAAEAEVRKHSEAVAEVARLGSTAEKAHALVESHTRLFELDRRASQDAAAVADSQQRAVSAKQELEPVVIARDLLAERINRATVAHTNAERHANAISAAIVTIASHIDHADTNCPVCSTAFEVGQLKILADEAAKSTNSALAKIATEIEQLTADAFPIRVRIEELQQIIEAPVRLERTWTTNRDIASKARAALAFELGSEVSADLGAAANTREQNALRELAFAGARQDELAAPAASAAERLLAFTTEIDGLAGQQAQALANLSALRSEDKTCSERVTARGMASWSIENINARLLEQRTILEAARAKLNQLAEIASTIRTQLESHRQVLAAAERTLAEAENARANSESVANQLKSRWTTSSLDGVPSRVTLDSVLSAIQEDVVSLRNLHVRLQELANANQEVLLKNELDEVISAMKANGGEEGFAQPTAYLEGMKKEHAVARAALKLTREARQAVNRFTESLKASVEDYSKQVLVPLNGVICDFNDAMLSTPGKSIQFKATHRVNSTTLGMSLQNRQRTETDTAQQDDIPPQVVLSEGQLAANGFSILCAASTAYQWSRWPALLLDDPLQHNDIIHAASFIDVMRNLVELEGYQLIMSSHDKGESEFIARKFDAAGLPCSRIVLSGPSDKGVLYEEPEYNSVAKAIIQGRTPATKASAY